MNRTVYEEKQQQQQHREQDTTNYGKLRKGKQITKNKNNNKKNQE